MSLAVVYSRALSGIQAPLVTVEVHLANGLPALNIVGLAETAVKESKDRVRAALINSRFEFPQRRITINLAPADLPKEGGRFDLPIALGILAASGQLPAEALRHYECSAELALTGALRPTAGILPAAIAAQAAGRKLIIAADNADEAARVPAAEVLAGAHLLAVCAHLNGQQALPGIEPASCAGSEAEQPDLADVRGQAQARRALEVAAVGGHSLLMLGPPGSGKTLLASRLPGILPPLTDSEALESAAVLSVSTQGFDPSTWRRRPFRAPHHTASGVALVGGGASPRPGEISLAHHGVLFLDELPEFDRRALETLREPLESGRITISRAARQAEFPARFQLIAAMNPCPCGWLGDASGRCQCTREQVQRYRARISGPLLDRIDLHVEVPRIAHAALSAPPGESSTTVRSRVIQARERGLVRAGKPNAQLDNKELTRDARLRAAEQHLLDAAMERLGLSARAYHRILRVARSCADLGGSADIDAAHLSEALAYRRLERV